MNKSKKDSREKMEETLDEAKFRKRLKALLAVPHEKKKQVNKRKK